MTQEVNWSREQIMEVLPHRDPMLLVDGVRRLEPGKSIDAWFTPGAEREIFQGHFPGNPILPGVYSVESMAQAAGIMVMTTERYRGKLSLFLGIDKVSFRRIVRPGETLELHAELVSERPEKAIITCNTEARVNGELAAQAQVVLAMR